MEEINTNIPEFFYDLIAVLFPGIFSIGYFYFLFPELVDRILIIYPKLNNFFVLLFIAYILGHISYSLSTVMIAGLFNFLSGNPIKTLLGSQIKNRQKRFNKYFLRERIEHDEHFSKHVTSGIKKFTENNDFDLNVGENIDIAYEFCRNFIIEKAAKNYLTIRKEQSYGELSRSLILIGILFTIWITFDYFYLNIIEYTFLKLILTLIIIISFSFRYGQVRHTVPIFIFSTFCAFLSMNQVKN